MMFTRDEMILMMLYSPGDRPGLIESLNQIKEELTPEETELSGLTESVLEKVNGLSDEEFDALELYECM